MDFLFKVFKKNSNLTEKAHCIASLFNQAEHQWIRKDKAFSDSLIRFLNLIPLNDLRDLIEKKGLLLLYCGAKMGCSFYSYKNRELILIFPDLYNLMVSAQFRQAHAVLAHEIGHAIHEHSKKKISASRAQKEADQYAWSLGLGEELIQVLQVEAPHEEAFERIFALKSI